MELLYTSDIIGGSKSALFDHHRQRRPEKLEKGISMMDIIAAIDREKEQSLSIEAVEFGTPLDLAYLGR